MKVLVVIFLMFNLIYAFGQDPKVVIQKMKDVYKKIDKIEYKCTYDLFKGHKSNESTSSYEGYVYQNKSQVYQKIDQTEIIYGTDFLLKANHNEKAISIDKKQEYQQMQLGEIEKGFKECRSITLDDKGDYYSITMILKSFSEVPFSVIKLRIEKKTYYLLQIDLYYVNEEDFSENSKNPEMAQPHLQIKYKDISFSPKDHSNLFLLSRYFIKKNNVLELKSDFKNYELIDNRNK